MKLLKKYLKTDNPAILLYENLLLVVFANLSFILSYYIKFAGNIPEYNYKPFFYIAPFYSVFIVIFNNYFNLFNCKALKDLIIKSIKSALLISMCSMAVAYSFRVYTQGIPTSVFIIATFLNSIIFIEIIKHRGVKK